MLKRGIRWMKPLHHSLTSDNFRHNSLSIPSFETFVFGSSLHTSISLSLRNYFISNQVTILVKNLIFWRHLIIKPDRNWVLFWSRSPSIIIWCGSWASRMKNWRGTWYENPPIEPGLDTSMGAMRYDIHHQEFDFCNLNYSIRMPMFSLKRGVVSSYFSTLAVISVFKCLSKWQNGTYFILLNNVSVIWAPSPPPPHHHHNNHRVALLFSYSHCCCCYFPC